MCPPHVCRASPWARSGSPPPAWTGAASPACSPRASHETSSCARSTSASLWALGSSRWTQRAPRRAAAPATSPPVCRASGAVAPASAFSCGASRSSRRRAGPCSARCTHPEHSTPTPLATCRPSHPFRPLTLTQVNKWVAVSPARVRSIIALRRNGSASLEVELRGAPGELIALAFAPPATTLPQTTTSGGGAGWRPAVVECYVPRRGKVRVEVPGRTCT